MSRQIYHQAIYWPEHLPRSVRFSAKELSWTRHAAERFKEKAIKLNWELATWDVVEAEYTDEGVKVTLRAPSAVRDWDVVLVVLNQKVLTLWMNAATDKHETLNRTHYTSRPAVSSPTAPSELPVGEERHAG